MLTVLLDCFCFYLRQVGTKEDDSNSLTRTIIYRSHCEYINSEAVNAYHHLSLSGCWLKKTNAPLDDHAHDSLRPLYELRSHPDDLFWPRHRPLINYPRTYLPGGAEERPVSGPQPAGPVTSAGVNETAT